MADTFTLPTVTAEVTSPNLVNSKGHVTATSLQIADNFGKQHKDVIRAIRKLEIPEDFSRRNFAPRDYLDERGKVQPLYQISRDGFALLAMGFTGKEAMQWKLAYISAFNAMEAKLRSLYIEPLVNDKQFRMGIPMHMKFKLQAQSQQIMDKLMAASTSAQKRNLYWQLRQVNDALGIPTESAEQLLGADAPALPAAQEGGAA